MADPGGPARGVLVTRPETPAAVDTAHRLRALGFTPVLAPMLTIRLLPFAAPGSVDAVLVTSGNALPALPPALHATLLLAVGDGTAERAHAAGFLDVRSAAGDADALAALARRTLPPGAVLLLATGLGQGAPLATALRRNGFRIEHRAVYDAGPAASFPPAARDAFDRRMLCAALFLSAATARAFARLLPPDLEGTLAGVTALAIAQPAADALGVLPWRGVRVSVTPSLEGVLALL